MHNKFFIVDGRYVWTGSANISDTGIGGYNANIVAYVDSLFLAKYYTIEFEQMYLNGDYHKNKKKLKKTPWIFTFHHEKITGKGNKVTLDIFRYW